jgi:SET domain-containing protein 6
MANFEQINTAFLDWLKANGTTVSTSIALQDYSAESAGRGVVAIADINVRSTQSSSRMIQKA